LAVSAVQPIEQLPAASVRQGSKDSVLVFHRLALRKYVTVRFPINWQLIGCSSSSKRKGQEIFVGRRKRWLLEAGLLVAVADMSGNDVIGGDVCLPTCGKPCAGPAMPRPFANLYTTSLNFGFEAC